MRMSNGLPAEAAPRRRTGLRGRAGPRLRGLLLVLGDELTDARVRAGMTISEGLFSAVSTPIFASEYTFFSIFRNLHEDHLLASKF